MDLSVSDRRMFVTLLFVAKSLSVLHIARRVISGILRSSG
jgi:hypothetical protein